MIAPFSKHVEKYSFPLFCIIDVTNKMICKLLSSGIKQNSTNGHISRICFSVISKKHTNNAEVFLYDSSFNNYLNTSESSITNITCVFSNTQKQTEYKSTLTLCRLKLLYVISLIGTTVSQHNSVTTQHCHNSKSVIFQEKCLKILKCYNFL